MINLVKWKDEKAVAIESMIHDTALATTVGEVRTHLRGASEGQTTATFHAATRLLGGVTTAARIRQFDLTIDEPVQLGGSDSGPNPVEVVLAALGTCQEIVYAVYAATLGIPIGELAIDVEGDLDPRGFFGVADVAPGFSAVRYNVRIQSSAPPERIRTLVETVNQHCPVLDILQRPLPVDGIVELNGQIL